MYAQENEAKESAPAVCDPALRSGQPAVLGAGLHRRTRYAATPLRSNNCGESDDEVGVSFGTPTSPAPVRARRSQKGELLGSVVTKRECVSWFKYLNHLPRQRFTRAQRLEPGFAEGKAFGR
ncbi:MAG: hypothetical protein RR857_20140, partial [Comamonas sp.]